MLLFVGGLMKSYQGTTSFPSCFLSSLSLEGYLTSCSSDNLVLPAAYFRNLLSKRQHGVTLVLQPSYS